MFRTAAIASWLLAAGAGTGCPAGYESQVALVQSARLILRVTVKSVTDAPKPENPGRDFSRSEDGNPGAGARAKVEVVETVRGSCSVKEFDLTGGPYSSCAPGLQYLRFEAGQTFFLLLDRPLPDDTEEVVVTWRCRVFRGSRDRY